MADNITGAPNERLRFDAPAAAPAGGAPAAGAATCSKCGTTIGAYYYEAGGAIYCARCKRVTEESAGAAAGGGGMGSAALYGLGAAVLGAIGYWLFIKVTGLDWALISIAVGIFVAGAVRKGSGGRSGRRFQFIAVALTYFAIGGAYAPLLIQGVREGAAKEKLAVAGDSTAARAPQVTASAPADAAAEDSEDAAADRPADAPGSRQTVRPATMTMSPGRAALFGALAAVAVVLAGPVLVVVFGGFPGALINVAIIGFALHRAWQMAGAGDVAAGGHSFTGPYKVGSPPGSAPAGG